MAGYFRSPWETMGILIQIGFLAAGAVQVINGQEGFVSIDCGMDEGGSIKDSITGIVYQPDTQFIDTGTNHKISKSTILTSWYPPQVETLRSFPDGNRNCYTIDQVNTGEKYLIRAFFLYGNHDDQDSPSKGSPLQFDLHLGVNPWRTVNVTNSSRLYQLEIITVAKDDYFSVCLVNTGFGTPFISSLELRNIDRELYKDVNQSNSLVLFARRNVGGSLNIIRYPNDTYDRIWRSWNNLPDWLRINTSETIQSKPDDAFQVPSIVMSSAITPSDNTSLLFILESESGFVRPMYYSCFHFAEFDSNKTRLINVIVNEQVLNINFQPSLFLSSHITLSYEVESYIQYDFKLAKAANSMLPPILNAMEIYRTLSLPNLASDRTDVRAMRDLKKLYNMKIWQGDPCAPQDFTWKGILCTISSPNPPRVTSLNLSSLRLTGNIPGAINYLKAIKYLDLSNNNFTGPIPTFLSGLLSLRMLNLSNNQLSGSIPTALRQLQENGLLELRTENNPDLCPNGNKCTEDGNKKTLAAPVIVAIVVIPTLLILLVIVLVVQRQRRKTPTPPSTSMEDQLVRQESRGFTYLELKTITNNFERVLGKGGFGTVYYGRLRDGTEVAVKLRARTSAQESMFSESQTEESDSKAQRIKEFQAEAVLLSRVHHRNLVSLIGYCNDNNCLGLVYEFAAQGSLKDHLTGKDGTGKVLNWRERLRIAVDAAQGLEYLHKGCIPPVIHGDVKTGNILLSQNLMGKMADFGLSKSFLTDDHTHVSTEVIVGTPGYVDPEYDTNFHRNRILFSATFGPHNAIPS